MMLGRVSYSEATFYARKPCCKSMETRYIPSRNFGIRVRVGVFQYPGQESLTVNPVYKHNSMETRQVQDL